MDVNDPRRLFSDPEADEQRRYYDSSELEEELYLYVCVLYPFHCLLSAYS